MSLMNVDITISGPGGCIEFESIVIERLFKELGYKVEVDDDHPFVERNTGLQSSNESVDEFIERVAQLNHSNTTINLKVKHRPWGG